MSKENSPNYYAVIPAHVRYCKELEPCARLLYGEITALSNQDGYCWATNEYFANLYCVDVRTIKRWMEALSRLKFIEIETKKEGMYWDRKIWISNEIKEFFTKGQKCPDRGDKNVPTEGTKMSSSPYNNTTLGILQKTTTGASGGAVVFLCLKDLEIPQPEKEWICKKYPENIVKKAVQYATHPDTIIKTTLTKTIKWACNTTPEIPKQQAEIVDENRAYAKAIERRIILTHKDAVFEVLSKGVELSTRGGQTPPIDIVEYTKNGFKEKLLAAIKKYERYGIKLNNPLPA